jgi:hypothetical protein
MGRVELPSHVHEPEAYVPPEPDADVEDDWPPASREIAVEQARQVRLEEGGLPVDAATLERVADAVMDPEYPVPGLYFTAEELADDERVEEGGSVPWRGIVYGATEELADEERVDEAGDDDLFGTVDEYLREHPEIDGGTRLGWRDGRRTLFVGLVGDAEAHKAPLLELGGGRVTFEHAPRTVRELETLADRIIDDRTALHAAGFDLMGIGRDQQRGVVHVELVASRGAVSAGEYFAGRYGDAVAVEWLGPSRNREVPHQFGSWTSEGRLIRVFFGLDYNGQQRGSARIAEESGERIVIALTRLQPVGATTCIGGFQPHHADLQLREPVGARAVIDASQDVIRMSLAQLRSR